ncbi:hypothetical protein GBAR_LOCUS22916 [Geodia barretti]|uniref:CARD domain-containing protein n=1 Tax=Geodia barretti TaxID=519541 RepID=A0AA35T4S4_GEOBA|nr:hypothetical protein GBAR_LOCUS22916 [Geodia barretti]
MEDRARRVLRANLAKIKESKFDPVWLAEELFVVAIVGEEERVAAKDETVSKQHRRDELLDLVMGNGGESVFQTFVNILSSKRHMHWLAMDLKDEFLRQGGVWMKEEPLRISDDIPETHMTVGHGVSRTKVDLKNPTTPGCACTPRVTVLGLSVCLSVSLSMLILALQATRRPISVTIGFRTTQA